jgi:hypothetical protein
MCLPERERRANPLVAAVGGHPDVGHDHVRSLGLDDFQQGVEVTTARDDLDIPIQLEQPLDALAHDEAVLGKDDADGHRASIRPPISTWADLPRPDGRCRAGRPA